jgi:hypothetical protein
MHRYAWHLTQELVLFSIENDDIEDLKKKKKKILWKLIDPPIPEKVFCQLSSSTELCNLV